jgi:hypothetical protein
MSERTLATIDQRTVEFYEDELIAVRGEDGQVYVAIRQMCQALGLDQRSQRRRIEGHSILSDGYTGGVIMTPPGPSGGGGRQQAALLRIDLVPLWLSTLDMNRVKDSIRPKLERFQREAAKVLWEAFQEGRLTTDPTFDELQHADTPAAQAYRMARALMELARQQLILESRLSTQEGRLDAHEARLEQIESTLGDRGRFITPEQATEISQAVKSIATALGKKSGRNEYGAVYGEFYRKFGIPSYRELPARRFDEAIRFLTDWFAEVTGQQGLPF